MLQKLPNSNNNKTTKKQTEKQEKQVHLKEMQLFFATFIAVYYLISILETSNIKW